MSKGVGNAVDLWSTVCTILAEQVAAVLPIRAMGFPEVELCGKVGGVLARLTQLIADRVR